MADGAASDQSYSFEWIAAPEHLAPYLNSLYIVRVGSDDVTDVMPAYSGQLLIVLEGHAAMKFAGGTHGRTGAAGFMCPLTQGHEFSMQAGSVIMGASLNFRGWAALTGLPVNLYRDRYLPVGEVFDASVAESCCAIPHQVSSGELTERQAADVVADLISQALVPLSERHAQVIGCTLEWLSSSFKPEIADLLEKLPYSERQVQRLVTKFFGQPPVRLIRRYRAIRAATILSMPELSAKLEEEVRQAFYDQAHMIKEIRHFTGRTPKRLQPAKNSMVKETLGEPGYGSVDLFGGNQDQELARKGH